MTIAIRPSPPYYAATEHVGCSPTGQTSRAPSAERREVFGESNARGKGVAPLWLRAASMQNLVVGDRGGAGRGGIMAVLAASRSQFTEPGVGAGALRY